MESNSTLNLKHEKEHYDLTIQGVGLEKTSQYVSENMEIQNIGFTTLFMM